MTTNQWAACYKEVPTQIQSVTKQERFYWKDYERIYLIIYVPNIVASRSLNSPRKLHTK